jgi:hypothetical protein
MESPSLRIVNAELARYRLVADASAVAIAAIAGTRTLVVVWINKFAAHEFLDKERARG